jgi:DNA-binding protein H-NS
MSLEDLWNLRENIQLALTNKIGLQKLRLENRLAELARNPAGGKARRPYPQVLPKYQNPANPGQTWSEGKATSLGGCAVEIRQEAG